MSQISVGDKVIRNDTVAFTAEDIFPGVMKFDQVYTVHAIYVKTIYVKTISDMHDPIRFTVAKLDIGEVNINLLDRSIS